MSSVGGSRVPARPTDRHRRDHAGDVALVVSGMGDAAAMNGSWVDLRTGDIYEWENPSVEVQVTENPVVHELLDAKGKVVRQWTERPPIGFAR